MKVYPRYSSAPGKNFPRAAYSHLRAFYASVLFLALTASRGWSADYYVDPATGNMGNSGTSSNPWSTLEAVFTANKTFVAGDVIHLRTGYHGLPQVKGINAGPVIIQPDTGAAPTLRRLIVKNASQWVITGLDICPENAGTGTYEYGKNLVEIQSTCSSITLENCQIKQALSIAGWTVTDWQTKLGKGSAVSVAGAHSVISGNNLENVSFGITVSKTGTFSQITSNTITAFYNDAMRGLADDCLFANNLLQDSYVSDSNHDDFFQSWSTNASGTVGKGTVHRITLRGNTFISRRDPNQPNYAAPQGIGCFDGMFEDFVIENNLIVTRTYHGIALYGAVNCKIVNNTVVENPQDGPGGYTVRPWILVTSHKANADGTPWSVPSSGNLIRNNISAKPASMVAGGGVIDHNQTTTAYSTYFRDTNGFDFGLKPDAPAVEAGWDTEAPTEDILGHARSVPYDIGAFETSPFIRWLAAHFTPIQQRDRVIGGWNAMPQHDGITNGLKFLCNIDPTGPMTAMDRAALPKLVLDLDSAGSADQLGLTFRLNNLAGNNGFILKKSSDLLPESWITTAPDLWEVVGTDASTGDALVQVKIQVQGRDRQFIRIEPVLP